MPIHACEAVFEYPADVYLYILVNPCNIQGGFSDRDLEWSLNVVTKIVAGYLETRNSLLREIYARYVSFLEFFIVTLYD